MTVTDLKFPWCPDDTPGVLACKAASTWGCQTKIGRVPFDGPSQDISRWVTLSVIKKQKPFFFFNDSRGSALARISPCTRDSSAFHTRPVCKCFAF